MRTDSSDPHAPAVAPTPEQIDRARVMRPIDKQRLPPGQLLEMAGRLLNTVAGGRSVLIVISMNRSDRLQALGQEASSREVMLEVVRRIRSILRAHDRYAVASHEEIWMLLADLPSASLAELAVRTLQQSLARPIHARNAQGKETVVQLRPAVGAAWTVMSANADPMILLTAATEAVKQAARAEERVCITRLETDDALLNRHTLEQDLRVALQNNELEVHFQPQIELASDRCVAVEALIRWNDAKRGAISPQVIAMLCEERGMMAQLTHFVLNTTLRHMMFWRGQNVNVNVAINISAMSLADATFPTQVAQALSTWGADPRRLTLELTESSIVENEHAALDFMNQLAVMGCRLSIDDFGTGYSSLAYLRQFPLNELKIDQTFVKHITDERGDQRIVQVLVDLAHTFDMRALAEGVESERAASMLRELGCDLAQGYHYSKPLPAKEFLEWFRHRGDPSPPLDGENIDARPSRRESALSQRIATEGVAAHGPATRVRAPD
ncbi:MAG: EAL domain-containing protein [Burkholderiaceae bacterium]